MWYFTGVLGLGLAASVGILNGLWYELLTVRQETRDEHPSRFLPLMNTGS